MQRKLALHGHFRQEPCFCLGLGTPRDGWLEDWEWVQRRLALHGHLEALSERLALAHEVCQGTRLSRMSSSGGALRRLLRRVRPLWWQAGLGQTNRRIQCCSSSLRLHATDISMAGG